MGAEIFFRYSLLASLIAGVIIGQTQRIVNAFWCLLLSYPMRYAALRRMRKRPPFSARSGEIAAGEADGFLWRGSATSPARSAGQRRVWGGNPNKYQTRGTNERSEIWATGRYLLYTLSPLFLIKWKSFLLRSTHFVSVEAVTLEHSNQLPTVYHSLDTLGNPPVANTQLVSAQHLADKLTHPERSVMDMGTDKWVIEGLSYTVQTAIDNGTQGCIFFSKLRPLHSDSSADIFGDFPLQRQIRRPVPRRQFPPVQTRLRRIISQRHPPGHLQSGHGTVTVPQLPKHIIKSAQGVRRIAIPNTHSLAMFSAL